MLYWYGVGVGVQSLLRGHLTREAMKCIVVPANYWRTLEFRLVLAQLRATASDKILDVGSPKLLSLYLADRVGASVVATDIEPYFINDYETFRRLRRLPEGQFRAMEADGRSLPFPDNAFTRVYSISVLEHIPGTGDTQCMSEIGRVLSPGGLCAITVPFASRERDEYRRASEFYWSGKSVTRADDDMVFFQRRYSEDSLRGRLIEGSGMMLRTMQFFGERLALPEGKEISQFLPPWTGFLHPLASAVFHEAPVAHWQAMRKPLGALVVLEKT